MFYARWPLTFLLLSLVSSMAHGADPWVVYEGKEGPGLGKHIVLVSGDEEYRSEEALPQFGKILATHHGFKCTVLFAVDPDSGLINPNQRKNIPGIKAIDEADLVVIFTRMRELDDESMQVIDRYLQAGKPVMGFRTATHAFEFPADSKWAHYSHEYKGDKKEWEGGFGRLVLGEKWVAHHGHHKHQATRGVPAPGAEEHPLLRGIEEGEIWGPTDVYTVRFPQPAGTRPIVLGQVQDRRGEYDESDIHYGMRPDDPVAAKAGLNNPMMPIVWTRPYQLPDGKEGKAVMSTIGSSTDMLAEGTRRMAANAVYWLLDMADKLPPEGAKVDIVGEFKPTKYEFRSNEYWAERKMTVEEYR
jgi:type 1 glutamine amidotransferase